MTTTWTAARADVGEDDPSLIPITLIEPQTVKDDDAPFGLEPVASHLELPWAITFLPDQRILVTERAGGIRVIENGKLLDQKITGVPQVLTGGHSGLLDFVLDPDFAITHRVYFSYMHGTPEAATIRIGRATLEGMTLVNKEVIFESRPALNGVDQLGGRIIFGPEGCLYMTIGDRMQRERAQNLLDHGGKIIRINRDGSVPSDNPFAGRPDALPEIYSYGHRNPQGLIYDRQFGRIWSTEQGPHGGDELNLIKPGANYGWPLVTWGIDYDGTIISDKTSAPGMEDPVYKWVPSLATANLAIYTGRSMPADWQGNLLIGGLAGEVLVRLEVSRGVVIREQRYLHESIGRIRDVAVNSDGVIYLLTDGNDASLYRVVPPDDQMARLRPFRKAQ